LALRFLYTLMESGESLDSLTIAQNGDLLNRLMQVGASSYRSPDIQRAAGETHREGVRLHIEKFAGLLWNAHLSTQSEPNTPNGIYKRVT